MFNHVFDLAYVFVSTLVLAAAKYYAVFLVSVLCHELAHVVVGKYYGMKFVRIEPGYFNWAAHFSRDKVCKIVFRTPKKLFFLSIAGWIAHVIIAIVSFIVLRYVGLHGLSGIPFAFFIVNCALIWIVATPHPDPNLDSHRAYRAWRDMHKAKKRKRPCFSK